MGGREVGGMANLLSGHRDLANAAHRAEVAALWGIADVPSKPGKTAIEMFQAAADGEIKALWIACTNPAQSMPDQATVRRALERAELVIVQEAFATTVTCEYADLLLPATTWGEKTGTVTNSERRISRVRPAVAAPGEARHDWSIAVEFARLLESELAQPPTLFNYATPESIWNEHRESTRGRDLDITGMDYAMLDAGARQWPLRTGETTGQARLYENGIFPTADGKARFANTAYQPVAEPREARYPFSLTTGRLRDQWHGMSRTGTLGRLFGHVAEPSIQMHPHDMARRQLTDGDLVPVSSRHGSIVVPLATSNEVGMGHTFIAMHWSEEFLSGISTSGARLMGVNALTNSVFCPTSKQPELKHTAVKILKAELPWSLLGVAWLPELDALAVREKLKGLMAHFPFASVVPFGRERTGLLFRAASHEAAPDNLITQIETLLGLDGIDVLRYADKKKGQRRAIKLERTTDNSALTGFVLAGDTSAEVWIKTLLQNQLPALAYGRLLLVPGSKAPVAVKARSRQICTCFNITGDAIRTELAHCRGFEDARLGQLQTALKCGTQCGSCRPEVRRMVRASMPTTQAA